MRGRSPKLLELEQAVATALGLGGSRVCLYPYTELQVIEVPNSGVGFSQLEAVSKLLQTRDINLKNESGYYGTLYTHVIVGGIPWTSVLGGE